MIIKVLKNVFQVVSIAQLLEQAFMIQNVILQKPIFVIMIMVIIKLKIILVIVLKKEILMNITIILQINLKDVMLLVKLVEN